MTIDRRLFGWVAIHLCMGTFTALPVLSQQKDSPAPTKSGLVLKEGTDVSLKFAQDLTSKTAAEGDPVMFTLAEDLRVNDIVIARAGAKATGEVTNAKKAGMMGKGGELNVRLDHLTSGDSKIKLRGTRGREGDSKVGTAVALTVLFGPVGLIKHGKNIEIREGTPPKSFRGGRYHDRAFAIAFNRISGIRV